MELQYREKVEDVASYISTESCGRINKRKNGEMRMKKSKRIVLCVCMAVISIFSVAGCGKGNSQDEEKELVVLTDTYLKNPADHMADFFMKQHPNIKIHVEMLVDESAEERSADLKKWNTQILAGKEPDVYLLSTVSATHLYENGMEETLIKNVNKTMQSGAFASLTPYMEKDPFWKDTNYNKNILEAGEYDGKQYVLPLSCQYFGLIGTEEGMIPDIDNIEALREYLINPYLFLLASAEWMQPAVDYEEGKVLFDKEKWSKFAADCIKADIEEENYEEDSDSFTISAVEEHMSLEMKECIALPNLNGKKIAEVEQYGAIGMSSDYKEEAYDFLMLFLNDEYEKEKQEGSSSVREFTPNSGVFLSECDGYFRENPLIFSSYQELDGAYFPTNVERFIYEEIEKIEFSETNGVAPDNLKEQCDNLANRIAEKYRMIVEE